VRCVGVWLQKGAFVKNQAGSQTVLAERKKKVDVTLAGLLVLRPITTNIQRQDSQGQDPKYNGPRGVWTPRYRYITHDIFCLYGAPLNAHKNGPCPRNLLFPLSF
jgi:hypothetical protein